METHVLSARLIAAALLLPLAACSPPAAPAGTGTGTGSTATSSSAPAEASSSYIAQQVHKGIDKAKQQLLTQNVDINGTGIDINGHDVMKGNRNLPKAQITPQGELLIAGKPVAATPAQHTLLLDYRQQIIGLAEAGMDIGDAGASVGIAAAKQAILGAFDGKSHAQIEASIKPETDRIKAAALALCKRLPGMLAAQQQLGAAMPAFKPYATMTQKDVDDCGKDADNHGKPGVAIFSD